MLTTGQADHFRAFGDDPRLIDAAEHLLGGPVIPECPEGVLYFAEAGWRTGDGTGVRGVKFALT